MRLLILEALGALLLLLLIVWWTMFAGRKRGEMAPGPSPDAQSTSEASSGALPQQIGKLDR